MAKRTEGARMKRFAFKWLVPREPGLMTHVMLLDSERPAPHSLAVGHGADEAQALLHLWTMLIDHHEPAEAIEYVAVAYERRTGKAPPRPGG
jgi:hypothetical protein